MISVTRLRLSRFAICSWRAIVYACVFSLLVSSPVLVEAAQKQKLEENYRVWLERDVAYFITHEERAEFLKLKTDDERDQFIDKFWELRNPNPGSPENTFRDEVYQRIAYANARFGAGSGGEGWRTDRGRTYITLGPPQQRETHYGAANLFPLEIWFYSYNHPSLPPFFYIMFYRHEGFGDFRYYSPFVDGPDKLVTGTEAIGSRSAALKMIQDSVGPEVERLAISLIPGEPIDTSQDRPSLQSDAMLATIKGLADNPFTKEELDRRRFLVENVTARILVPGQNLEIATLPLRDSRGFTRLDYVMRFRQPSDFAPERLPDGHYSLQLGVQVNVFDSENKNKLIFAEEKKVSNTLDKAEYADIMNKRVGYQGSLPLPPGKYHIEFILTDWESKKALQAQKDVVIPEIDPSGITIGGVLPFSSAKEADPATAEFTPFTLAGLKFAPLGTNPLTVAPDVPIQVAYQLWAAPRNPESYGDKKINVEYAVGRPAAAGDRTTVSEEVAEEQFDPTGTLVTGKKLPLQGRPPGNYLLNISVAQPGTAQRVYSSLPFSVFPSPETSDVWDLTDPTLEKDATSGVWDRQRALCLVDQEKGDEARPWFRRALALDHTDEIARTRLVDAYYGRKDYSAVLSLYKDAGITEHSGAETIIQIADSLDRSGNLQGAISLIESALRTRPESGPLYLALSGYYQKQGNTKKAAELEKLGKSYL